MSDPAPKFLNVSVSQFMAAIVVGAAFQNIKAPVMQVQNIYLLIAFIVVMDDFVLFNVQAAKVKPKNNLDYALTLLIDTFVLLLWYCAAASAAGLGEQDPNRQALMIQFYGFLVAFYISTLVWELIFKAHTEDNSRLWPDGICAALFLFAMVFHGSGWFNYIAAPALIIIWACARWYAWLNIVLEKRFRLTEFIEERVRPALASSTCDSSANATQAMSMVPGAVSVPVPAQFEAQSCLQSPTVQHSKSGE